MILNPKMQFSILCVDFIGLPYIYIPYIYVCVFKFFCLFFAFMANTLQVFRFNVHSTPFLSLTYNSEIHIHINSIIYIYKHFPYIFLYIYVLNKGKIIKMSKTSELRRNKGKLRKRNICYTY